MRQADLIEERADLLDLAEYQFNRIGLLQFDKDSQYAAIRQLNEYQILSLAALASITGSSMGRARKASVPNVPTARGRLNPYHIDFLRYLLRQGEVKNPEWVKVMLDNGTSVSTIEDITLISRSSIYRSQSD